MSKENQKAKLGPIIDKSIQDDSIQKMSEIYVKEIGKLFSDERKKHYKRTEDFSSKMGLIPGSVNHVERGARVRIGLVLLSKYCQALGRNPADFIGPAFESVYGISPIDNQNDEKQFRDLVEVNHRNDEILKEYKAKIDKLQKENEKLRKENEKLHNDVKVLSSNVDYLCDENYEIRNSKGTQQSLENNDQESSTKNLSIENPKTGQPIHINFNF